MSSVLCVLTLVSCVFSGPASIAGTVEATPHVDNATESATTPDAATPNSPEAEAGASSRDVPRHTPPSDPDLLRAIPRDDPEPRDILLVGAIIDGRASGSLEVLRDGPDFLLPVDELDTLLDIQISVGAPAKATTPLGTIDVPEDALQRVDGRLYLSSAFLSSSLRIEVRFDTSQYALLFKPLWHSLTPRERKRVVTATPDATAPDMSLAGVRASLTHTKVGGQSIQDGDVRVHGRMLNGQWNAWIEDSTDRPFEAREYLWQGQRGKSRYLIGRQHMQLHSSLTGFDMVGAQIGYSNRGHDDTYSDGTGSLMGRGVGAEQTFTGSAPAGSFVRLRVDGQFLAAQQVGFDGTYAFYRVPLPTRQATLIEVLIYDPGNLQIPIETRRQRLASSELLLEKGTIEHAGGLGLAGIFNKGLAGTQTREPTRLGGFYRWRQGFAPYITGEATVQHDGERLQSFAGIVARVSDTWVLGAGLSHGGGSLGYNLELDGFVPDWQIFARSISIPAEFGRAKSVDRHDHRLEVVNDAIGGLSLGFVARDRVDGSIDERFVLPLAHWRPHPSLALDARPDAFGDYLLSGSWVITPMLRLRSFTAGTTTTELVRDLGSRYQVGVSSEYGGGFGPRHTAFAHRAPDRVHGLSLRAGVVRGEGHWGMLASATAPVIPGLALRAEYQSLPFRSALEGTQGRLLINLVSDLGHAGGRFMPATAQTFNGTRGAIAGRLAFRSDDAALENDLEGIAIMVAGRVRTRTDSRGYFYISNLEPGIHAIELDPARLPLELTPVKLRVTAEVEAGAATRVDFPLRLEFGAAGRVLHPDGSPIARAAVTLVDATGAVVGHGTTDRFGLYRLDGIEPGTYTVIVRLIGGDHVAARRPLVVSDAFLFNQDVHIGEIQPPSGLTQTR